MGHGAGRPARGLRGALNDSGPEAFEDPGCNRLAVDCAAQERCWRELSLPVRAPLISLPAMRNPIRLKNLNFRFLPLYLVGLSILVLHPPRKDWLVWGLPLIGVGALLRSWGAGHLVKNHALTLTGPYAHVRHPLYVGTILIATGFALAISGWLSLVALAVIWPWFAFHYFPRKEAVESDRLEARYGERFTRYRMAVPALWPRLHAWVDAETREAGSEGRWTFSRYSENNELGTLLAVCAGLLVFWLRASA